MTGICRHLHQYSAINLVPLPTFLTVNRRTSVATARRGVCYYSSLLDHFISFTTAFEPANSIFKGFSNPALNFDYGLPNANFAVRNSAYPTRYFFIILRLAEGLVGEKKPSSFSTRTKALFVLC